jgi:dephospho-CoA kinase
MEHLYQCNGGNFTFTHDWVKRFMKRNKLKYDMVADETFQTMYDLTKEQNADRKIKNSVDTTKLRNNQTV